MSLDLDEDWTGALASPADGVATVAALSAEMVLAPPGAAVSVVVGRAPSTGPFQPGAGPMKTGTGSKRILPSGSTVWATGAKSA
ncbi:MAG TPA: hypothetical protein VGG86_15970, partial [Roseiarcus sp.]